MAKEGGFFSGSARRDNRIAGNLGPSTPIKNYGGNMGFSQDFGAGRVTNVKPKKGFGLKDVYGVGTPRAQFFSPSGNEVGQIASATTDLSNLFSQLPSNYKETEQNVIQDNQFNKYLKDEFGTTDMNYGDKQFFREAFDEGDPYKRMPFNKDQSFKTPTTDTKVAMLGGDNLGSMGAIGGALGLFGLGLRGIQSAIEGGKKLKENIEQRVNPEQNKVSVGDQVGGFLNRMMGISPVAAGTLDANQQVSQVSERPKLNYVNPDATRMSVSEMADAFKPKNLFGYKDKFGRFDDPGSPLARDRAETIQRVAQNFSTPITADARTIGQIRADQEARMRENARLRNESFQRGERVQQKSADVTFGTGMLSNPAYRGLRENMSPEAQKKYDQSARDATEMARTDPSLGNVLTSGVNFLKGQINKITGQTPFTREKSLEKIGERQLRLANKEINRPTYQKEAYARKFLGITNDQLKAKNLQQIRANAFARNQAFQNERAQRALQIAANRRGENVGTGRDGGFGTGTSGQGMPSNPKGFSGYSRKSSPSTGTGTGTSPSRTRSRGGISKSTSRGQGGGSSSRSKGGVSKGGSKAKASGSRGQGGGTASRSKGGSFGGSRRSTNTSKSRRRCDIRTKIDITSLTNQNLIKDDLAKVAYFVQELREK